MQHTTFVMPQAAATAAAAVLSARPLCCLFSYLHTRDRQELDLLPHCSFRWNGQR